MNSQTVSINNSRYDLMDFGGTVGTLYYLQASFDSGAQGGLNSGNPVTQLGAVSVGGATVKNITLTDTNLQP